MTPIIFLDIDGVLNGHEFDPLARSVRIKRECVDHLNWITDQTRASLVISSAWRYMVLNGAMTLDGFTYMMRTHGVHAPIVGVTCSDEDAGWTEKENPDVRGIQILRWMAEQRRLGQPVGRRLAIDDNRLGITIPLRLTDGTVGLTREDAVSCVSMIITQETTE